MALINWLSAVSDLFSNAARWGGGVVPGASDDANLGTLSGAAYTVTSQNQTVNSLRTAANAILALNPNTNFALTNGTGSGANAGQISVANNDFLYIGGTFNNTSTVATGGIVLNGVANATEIRLRGAATTFTGGGKVVLGTGGNNYVVGDAGAANKLVNVDNSFSGVGNIGAGGLTLDNQTAGIINANQTGQLTLQVNGGVTNTGTIEATNTGGLFILNTGIDNSGSGNAGKIVASGSGAHVDLQNSSITGGTLTSGVGAQIDIVSGQTSSLDGTQPGAAVNITAGTNLNLNNNTFIYIAGAINNAGSINLLGVANGTALRLTSPVTTLTGGGKVVFSTGGNNYIVGNGGALDELDNVNNTISGVGNIGVGGMTLVNETAGIINADQTGQLVLQVNGGVTNTGLIEATSTGGLFVLNTSIDNSYSSGAGKISAVGAGAHVDLQNSTIFGGTLTTSGAGAMVDVVGGQTATLDGTYSLAPIKIVAGSTVMVNNNSTLYLRGAMNNAGVINVGVAAGPNGTSLRLNSPVVTLTGGGVVQLANSASNYITSNDNYSETLNNVDNTIQGSGNVGNGSMTLINGKLGKILANQSPGVAGSGQPGQLVLQVNGGVTNNGLIESVVPAGGPSGGDLFILNTVIDQTGGGKIEALGLTINNVKVGSTVDLQNSTIRGGSLLSTAGPSQIQVVGGQAASFDGVTKALTNSAIVNVNNNSSLNLLGVISNKKGTINLLAGANNSNLIIASTSVTLNGVGKITMSDSVNNRIYSNNGFQTLYNVDNTISGAGNIGVGSQLQLVNETLGVVNATATNQLVLNASRATLNYGLIESNTNTVGAGGLFILNTVVDNTVANATNVLNTGKITAAGTTGHVDLQNSNIYGGTLSTSGGGVIDVVSGQAAGLNGTVLNQAVNLASGTQFVVNNNATLYLYGAINNAGTITLSGGANTTQISLNSSVVTLSGGGQLVLAGGSGVDRIIQNQGNAKLDNVNNTISGGGSLGAGGAMYLTNESAGVINATLAGGLAINLGGVTMVNAGLLEATGSALSVTNSVFNTGTIAAHGGNVTIGGNVNGVGAETLFGASSLEIGSSVGPNAAQTVTFSGGASGSVFKIDNAQSFSGTVVGLSTGKTIDLGNVNFAGVSLSYSGTTTSGVLTVTDGATTSTIKLTGNYVQANFTKVNDGSGHTDISYNGTGLAPSPALNQMVSAMASMTGGGSASSLVSSVGQSGTGLRLATPHAA